MIRFYTADLHFNHPNIIKYCNRPFTDGDDMNLQLIENINETCTEDDELWILGDYNMKDLDGALGFLSLFRPECHLIIGNHEKCFVNIESSEKSQRKARAMYERYYGAGFETVMHHGMHQIGKHNVVLSHFPYRGGGDRTEEERYSQSRPIDEGRWLLCGHVHDAWAQRGRMINVGVDVRGYYPISEYEIEDIINLGPRDIPEVEDV